METHLGEKGLLIVDKNFCIVSSNEVFRTLYPQTKNGQICYKAFYGFDKPCPHCRIVSRDFRSKVMLNPTSGTWINSEMEKLEVRGLGECYSIQINSLDGGIKPSITSEDTLQHIQEANDLWNTALNNMPNGYHRCDVDSELTLINVSDRFCEILGFTKEELKTLFDNKFINLVHPDDLSQFMSFMKDINNNGNHYYAQWVYRIKCKTGYIWVIDSTKYVKSGVFAFLQGTITDV